MDLWHFEDYPVGLVREFGAYEVTAESVVAFAREFDPQPFHLDPEAARASLLGGLAASESRWKGCGSNSRAKATMLSAVTS